MGSAAKGKNTPAGANSVTPGVGATERRAYRTRIAPKPACAGLTRAGGGLARVVLSAIDVSRQGTRIRETRYGEAGRAERQE